MKANDNKPLLDSMAFIEKEEFNNYMEIPEEENKEVKRTVESIGIDNRISSTFRMFMHSHFWNDL